MKYLIDFTDNATSKQIESWMTKNQVVSKEELNVSKKIYLVETLEVPEKTKIVESIVLEENISTQLLNRVEIIPASDGEISQFNHDSDWWKTASVYEVDFDAEESTFERRGSKTTVYVVDSGVNINHVEFEGADVSNLFSFNGNFDDLNSHGTSIASVIVGKNFGITSSKLKSVKVFDDSKSTMTSDLVTAFDAILQDVLSNEGSIAIVNLSWAIPKNEYIESKIQSLINAGAFVVAAAGNNGVPIENVTPASMDGVLTVGAYTQDFVPADFSNYTSDISNTENATNYGSLDAWAPGVNIAVALANGGTGSVSGTSISAGITTACLAYNSDNLYSNVGYAADIDFHLKMYSTAKKGMLTFSEQYSASVNRIATFITAPVRQWTHGTYNVARVAYDNQDLHGFLAYSAHVSKIELDKDLPEGLSLSNGWVVGRLTTAPAEAEKREYVVTITYTTGDISTARMTLLLAPVGTPAGDMPAEFQIYAGGCSPSNDYSFCAATTCSSGCPNCDAKSGDCPCDAVCN